MKNGMEFKLARFAIGVVAWSMLSAGRPGSPIAAGQTVRPTLRRTTAGNTDGVRLLQSRLNSVLRPSPKLSVDGRFGPATENAVKRFQRGKGLEADGIVGAKTWAALFHIRLRANVTTSARMLAVLRTVLDHAEIDTAEITSGDRTARQQARVMYDNIRRHGIAHQKRLYGPSGDRVIEVYESNRKRSRNEVIALMADKIKELGPGKVSRHCAPGYDVIDVAPSSIGDDKRFRKALAWALDERILSRAILPPADPAFHLERKE